MDQEVADVTSGEWEVAPLDCHVSASRYSSDPFDRLCCTLHLTRKPLHYVFNLVSMN
jgi:hypothetical protein